MTGKQTAVLWIGLILVLLNVVFGQAGQQLKSILFGSKFDPNKLLGDAIAGAKAGAQAGQGQNQGSPLTATPTPNQVIPA